MDVNAILNAPVASPGAGVLDSGDERVRQTPLGELLSVDWRMNLVRRGRVHRLSLGQVTGGGDIGGLAGNASALDLDQPEAFVAIDSGFLIPMDLEVSFLADADAYDDIQRILLTADRTQAVAAGGTFVEAEANLASANGSSIQNLLDGGDAFGGRAASAVTADITDPVHSDILAHRVYQPVQLAAETAGQVPTPMELRRTWREPTLLAGPCSLLLYVAGTNAPTILGSLTFAHIPSSWFPLS